MHRLFPFLILVIIGVSWDILPEPLGNRAVNILFNLGLEAPLTPYTNSMLKFNPSSVEFTLDLDQQQSPQSFSLRELDLYEIKLPLLYLIDSLYLDLDSMGAPWALCKGIQRKLNSPTSLLNSFTITYSNNQINNATKNSQKIKTFQCGEI